MVLNYAFAGNYVLFIASGEAHARIIKKIWGKAVSPKIILNDDKQ